jgi:putative oxidoreductase
MGPARFAGAKKEEPVNVSTLISGAQSRALTIANRLEWVAPLVARVTLGVLFVSTGWGKVHDLDKVTAFFTDLGIPAPHLNAVMVSFVELIGGSLLLIGLASRLAALPLIASMAVAILTAQREQVHGLPDLFGLVEWTYLALLLWVAISGPGKASIDHLLVSRRRASTPPAFSAPSLINH